MVSHSIHACKILPPPGTVSGAARYLLPELVALWAFEYWQIQDFTYVSEEPFEGPAPPGVAVRDAIDDLCFSTDREGLLEIAPILSADWSSCVGLPSLRGVRLDIRDLLEHDYVILCCIDSVHWICAASDDLRLQEFAHRIPYESYQLVIETEALSDWGL